MSYTKMNPEAKKRWIKALTSGKYKQGKDYLCKFDSRGELRYCCLGVLCEEEVEGDWVLQDREIGEACWRLEVRRGKGVDSNAAMPPIEAERQVGLSESAFSHLASMNDLGVKFKTIAKWIENNL